MDANDRPKFVSLVDALAASFGREVDEALLSGYWLGLDDLSLSAIEKAVAEAIRSYKFMPAPAVLRELAGEMLGEDRVQLAWDSMVAAISEVGGYRSITFEDPAITASVRALGGWERICSAESEELHKWLRKDFERVYPTFARKPRPTVRIAGIHEIANAGRPGTVLEERVVPAPYLTTAERKQIEGSAPCAEEAR